MSQFGGKDFKRHFTVVIGGEARFGLKTMSRKRFVTPHASRKIFNIIHSKFEHYYLYKNIKIFI